MMASGGAEAVRVFQYPVVDHGNLSFPDGEYAPELKHTGNASEVRVVHRLSGAALFERMLEAGQAAFCCSVSIPATGYREVYFCGGSREHVVRWDPRVEAEPPFFRPMLVCMEETRVILGEADGVHQAWYGHEVVIKKGTKLGFGPYFRGASALQHLLEFQADDSLRTGEFRLDEPSSSKGFYFPVRIDPNLMGFLRSPASEQEARQRRSILTHVVSVCFERLRRDYGRRDDEDEGWKAFANLRALNAHLEECGLSTWEEADFCPEYAATVLYPHLVPNRADAEDETE